MDVKLPRLGEGADSGVVSTIFVKVGDQVKKDQPILELESEKAVASIPSPGDGVVAAIHVKEGDEIKVGRLLITLTVDGTTAQVVEAKEPEPATSPTPVAPSPQQVIATPAAVAGTFVYQSPSGMPPPAAPSIRKMAAELGIDLTRVKGSQRGGRIVLDDLRAYIHYLQSVAFAQPPHATAVAPEAKPELQSIDFAQWGPVVKKKMSQLRKTISSRMVDSWRTIPHVTQFENADITDLLKLRKKHVAAYEKKGAHLTITPFILKAVVGALKQHPIFNASLDEVTNEIVYKNYCHIGIAVDTEQGLIVPVIRDVEKKSMLDLSIELNDLAERTRSRKVTLEEMQGGTFTISNQGGIGGAHFTPVINKPEVAILGIGRGALTPVATKTKIEKRMLVPLGLSYDHRVIDGGNAARFITDLVDALRSFKESDVKLKGK